MALTIKAAYVQGIGLGIFAGTLLTHLVPGRGIVPAILIAGLLVVGSMAVTDETATAA